jgi:hypothetical protein
MSEGSKTMREITEQVQKLADVGSAKPETAGEFTLPVTGASADGASLRVKLCTGTTIAVPVDLLQDAMHLGHVQSGDQTFPLGRGVIDQSTPAGELVAQLAGEVQRLAARLDLLTRAHNRGRSDAHETSTLRTQQVELGAGPAAATAVVLPAPPANSFVVMHAGQIITNIPISCPGHACDIGYSVYTAPPPRPIATVLQLRATGCQLVSYAINGRTLTVYHTGIEDQVCGDGYSGKVSADIQMG